MTDFAKELLASMTGNVTRTSCLAPFQWSLGITAVAIVGSLAAGAPAWLLISLTVFAGINVMTFLGVSVYFSITAPDNLRSERYSINKMAIERGIEIKGIPAIDTSFELKSEEPAGLIEVDIDDEVGP